MSRPIHVLRRRIEIAESATELGSGLAWGAPKTHERRVVTMPAFLAERFAERLGAIADDDLVFTAPRGGPLRSAPFRQSVWVPALEAASLDRLRIHDRRRHRSIADDLVPKRTSRRSNANRVTLRRR